MIVTDDMPSLQTHIATDDKDADTKRLQERSRKGVDDDEDEDDDVEDAKKDAICEKVAVAH